MAPTESVTAADWKARLYGAYVSSGQVETAHASAGEHYRPRSAYIRAVITRHLPPSRNARILDLPCGDGAWLYFLQRAGYSNLGGVDASPEQIAQAHRLGVRTAEHGNIRECLALQHDSTVGAVILCDILEHLTPGECIEVLDEVYRVLEPSGRCLIHVPNAAGLFGMTIAFGDYTHERAFTARSITQIASTAKFSRVSCYEDKPVVHGLASAARRVIWEAGTAPLRILSAAETGRWPSLLSRNLLAVAWK